jgi:hypothetical protein
MSEIILRAEGPILTPDDWGKEGTAAKKWDSVNNGVDTPVDADRIVENAHTEYQNFHLEDLDDTYDDITGFYIRLRASAVPQQGADEHCIMYVVNNLVAGFATVNVPYHAAPLVWYNFTVEKAGYIHDWTTAEINSLEVRFGLYDVPGKCLGLRISEYQVHITRAASRPPVTNYPRKVIW